VCDGRIILRSLALVEQLVKSRFFANYGNTLYTAESTATSTRGVPHSIAFCAIEWGRQTACDTLLFESSSITDAVLQSNYSILRAFGLKRYNIRRMPHPYAFFAQGWDSLDINPGTYFL